MVYVILSVGILMLVMTLLYFIYLRVFHTPVEGQNDPFRFPSENPQYAPYKESQMKGVQELLDTEHELVYIQSYDGLKLGAKIYRFSGSDDAPLAVCFHGWHGMDIRDFRGGVAMLRKMGYNVLLASQRGHGISEGHTLTYGIKERQDVLSWTRYAVERFGEQVQIVLFGVSMGAATVLMASELPLPEQVKGIMADSPYTSPKEIIKKVIKDMKLAPGPLYPLVAAAGLVFGHVRLNSAQAVESVKHTDLPILIMHGDDDRFVPCAMSEEIQKANPAIRRAVFPGAGHVLSCLKDETRYYAVAGDFLGEIIQPRS